MDGTRIRLCCLVCRKETNKANFASHIRTCSKEKLRKTKDELGNFHCLNCNFSTTNPNSIGGHTYHCKLRQKGLKHKIVLTNPRIPWNKGLTKETDDRVRKNSINVSKAMVGMIGKKHTYETKQKLSKIRSKFISEGKANTKYFKVYSPFLGKEINVQGSWEFRLAIKLNELKIDWDRRYLEYGHRRYTPDFYLPEFNLYLEVKGWLKDRDIMKMSQTLLMNPGVKIALLGDKILKKFEAGLLGVLDLKLFQPVAL